MRSRRSSPRSRTSFSHHGTVITATPTSVARTASRANWICPSAGCRTGRPRSRRRRTPRPRSPATPRTSRRPGRSALRPSTGGAGPGRPPATRRPRRPRRRRAVRRSSPTTELPAALPAIPTAMPSAASPTACWRSGLLTAPDDVGRLLPHEDPQQAVGEHPGAADAREHHERGPHPQHRHTEVLRDAARHARHEPPGAQADERRGRRTDRGGRRGGYGLAHPLMVTRAGPGDIGGSSGDSRGASLMERGPKDEQADCHEHDRRARRVP